MASAIPTTASVPAVQASGSGSSFDLLGLFFGTLDDGDEEGRHQRWSSFIGIIVAICGNILISFALNMQRYAHVRIEQEAEGERVRLRSRRRLSMSTYGSVEVPYRDEPEYYDEDDTQAARSRNGHYQFYSDHEARNGDSDNMDHSVLSDNTLRPDYKSSLHGDRISYLHSPYWWAGIVLMTLGEMGNFLAYGFAPASIVSPLGVVALISNCIIAPFLLKEKFRPRDFWGVLIAIAGAVVVVLSAETSETKIGPHDIWVMITKWEFEVYMGITAALIIVLMYLSEKYGGRTILIDLGLVGLFGAYTALSTKGVASLLSFTLWHVITFPISYLLVAVLVTSALMQVRYINRALQRFDSTQVIPTQFVLFTLSVIIGSAVLYRDFESATLSRSLKFVGGCALTFLGVYFITSGRVRNDDDDISYGDDDDDEEEAVGFLNEERYRDSMDEPSPLEPRPRRTNDISSPLRQDSVRSATSERQSLSTPKGLLSPVGSDHEGSYSEDSLSQELTTPSPPLRSQSLTDNPWASPSNTNQTPSQLNSLQESTAATPHQYSHIEQTPPLLLRFPAAPTHDDNTSSTNIEPHGKPTQSLQMPADTKVPTSRRRSTPRTPQSNARNSVHLRLTPSPLITPLSSTLSAVVADSLLRGEGNPAKHGRSRSLRVRRLPGEPLIPDGMNSDGQLLAHDTDRLAGERHIGSSAVTVTSGSSRFNSANDVRPAEDRQDTDSKSDHDQAATRIRSFSDSISGHLAWLGGTLLGSKRPSGAALPSQSGENEPGSQDAQS